MNSTTARAESEEDCLVHSIARTLATEPTLEAVTIDREKRAISVATLGRGTDPDLEKRVASTVEKAQKISAARACGLLEGKDDCRQCAVPFGPYERQSIVIRHEATATTIARVSCPTAPRFWRWRNIPWPVLSPREIEIPDEHAPLDEWKPQLAAAISCGVLALSVSFVTAPTARLILHLAAYLAGSWYAAEEVIERLRERKLDVHFLMLAVALGSASIGAWGEGATLLFLFSISGALEHYAMGRTQKEIRALFQSAPKTALLLDEAGREREISVDEIQPGMRLLIKPDTQFPADAELVRGASAADESNLTGEAMPVDKAVGDSVLAGTLNLWGAVEVTVTRAASESALQKIIRLIKDAQHLKAPAQRLTDKFGTGYTYGILGLAAGMYFVWRWGFAFPAHTAFYRSMTLLVVASPCALVLSIPSAILAAIAWGARRGILFRGGAAVEKLAEVTVVALDKTGTLTTGELQVAEITSVPPGRSAQVLQLAYSLERFSHHPLARAITRHARKNSVESVVIENVEAQTGSGLQGRWQGHPLFLGRRDWLAGKIPSQTWEKVSGPEAGCSEVWVATEGLLGRILLRDQVRPQGRALIEKLRAAGLRTLVLTGDRAAAAAQLQASVGPDEIRSGLRPEEKVAAIQALSTAGNRVAMVGDGVNDAPSLAAAHVGVAMGARGSDAALEQAEVVLMNDRLENFLAALQLSRRAKRIINQNLILSLGTVVVLVGFAMAGAIPLTLGVVGHEGSTVIVVLNSLRLLFSRDEPAPVS